jgi:hypothetical protein
MTPVGWSESALSAGERPQNDALDRAATGTDPFKLLHKKRKKES